MDPRFVQSTTTMPSAPSRVVENKKPKVKKTRFCSVLIIPNKTPLFFTQCVTVACVSIASGWGRKTTAHTAHRGWACFLLNRARDLIIHAAASTARRWRRTRTIRTAISSLTTPRGGTTLLPRRAQPLLLLFRSNPPTEGGGRETGYENEAAAGTAAGVRPPRPADWGTVIRKGGRFYR